MRVCAAHKVQAVETFKSIRDDSEVDLCPECLEAFNLIVSGAFFEEDEKEPKPRRGRQQRETT
jgi:hypothetical protein